MVRQQRQKQLQQPLVVTVGGYHAAKSLQQRHQDVQAFVHNLEGVLPHGFSMFTASRDQDCVANDLVCVM